MNAVMRDKNWIENATVQEMTEAIRTEPPMSELFQGELGVYFWDTYRSKMEVLYGDKPRVGDDHVSRSDDGC